MIQQKWKSASGQQLCAADLQGKGREDGGKAGCDLGTCFGGCVNSGEWGCHPPAPQFSALIDV